MFTPFGVVLCVVFALIMCAAAIWFICKSIIAYKEGDHGAGFIYGALGFLTSAVIIGGIVNIIKHYKV
jgi:hypothetical protein